MFGFLCFMFAVFFIAAVVKGVLATYAPKAYEAFRADEERRRQRRSEFLKSAVGAGFRWWGK